MLYSIYIIVQLLLAITAPSMRATWDRPGVARISWIQPTGVKDTCFYREPAGGTSILIECWPNVVPGPNTIFLGNKGPLDALYKPQGGDQFVLRFDDDRAIKAALRSVGYLPVFRGR